MEAENIPLQSTTFWVQNLTFRGIFFVKTLESLTPSFHKLLVLR